MKSVCQFCRKFGGAAGAKQMHDRILFESENFVVVPTLGSIVPGWLLLVPRSHFLSVGSLSAALIQELVALRAVAREALEDCFGPVTSFEHGAVRDCESVGCGVDHAHLHLVASKLDLVAGVKAVATPQLHWRQVAGIQATQALVVEQMPYVFVQPPTGGAWIGAARVIESQLMRKVIAAYVGRPDCWDWKAHSFEANANETVLRVETWNARRAALSAPA